MGPARPADRVEVSPMKRRAFDVSPKIAFGAGVSPAQAAGTAAPQNQPVVFRRAFTLIEMVAVITVGSAITGVGVVMLVAMLKSEGSSRRHLELCKTLTRLDEQFRARRSCGGCRQAGRGGELPGTRGPRASQTLIRYHCQLKEITREESEGDKTLRRESYPLPEDVTAALGQQGDGPITTLILRAAEAGRGLENPLSFHPHRGGGWRRICGSSWGKRRNETRNAAAECEVQSTEYGVMSTEYRVRSTEL